MSRSYRRHAVTKDENSRFGKKMSVKTIRRAASVANGGSYKKHYCSWNICDYRIYSTFARSLAEWREMWETDPRLRRKYPTWKQAYRSWVTYYRRK